MNACSIDRVCLPCIQQTEQHPLSYRLELDGYLSKPTTRLGRYTLFLDNILKYTAETSPDRVYIPKASSMLRSFLARVNEENGKAKNRFDLERLSQKLQFKHKSDEMASSMMLMKNFGGSGSDPASIFLGFGAPGRESIYYQTIKATKNTEQRLYRV